MAMTPQQAEDAKALAVAGIRGLLKAEDYESAATAVQLFKHADPQFGRRLEFRMPAMVINNSPTFTGTRAMAAMRWTNRTPDWHDQIRRHAASPRLGSVVERIAAEIDAHERGD